ncbi:hypothetical protein Tco_0103157 [Tanacetum coccineum]
MEVKVGEGGGRGGEVEERGRGVADEVERWQKKMHFLLSSMSVVYVLTTLIPEDGENVTVVQLRKRAKTMGFLGGLKYMAEDASSKKFLVSCIIDKLLHSWKDFKHTLKHQKEELTLVELDSHLRIEESLRV